MENTFRLTFGESAILFILFASFAAFLQLWIVAGVGKIRIVGWLAIIAATYLSQLVLFILSGVLNLDELFPSGTYAFLLIPFVSLGIPWAILPWRKFRSSN